VSPDRRREHDPDANAKEQRRRHRNLTRGKKITNAVIERTAAEAESG
jgi:hypothetical protein